MCSEGYGTWSVCVCLSVSHISPLKRLFVLKTLSCTQQTTEVKIFVGFCLKPLRWRDPTLPPLKAICTVGHFLRKACICMVPRVLHFSAFILTYFILQVQISSSLHQFLNNSSLTPPGSHHQYRVSLLYVHHVLCINTLNLV